MKILLLGGNGFIGDYLAAKLKQKSRHEFKVVGRASLTAVDAGYDYIRLDLSRPDKKIQELIDWSDVVVVLTRDKIQIIDNLLAALRARCRPIRIVYLSTLLLYSDSDLPQDESVPVEPKTDYEKSKYVEEQKLLQFVTENTWCKLCVVRMANVYGDIKNRGVINSIFHALSTSAPLRINGPGDSARDYIFIEDAAELLSFLTLWQQESSYEIVNICNGQVYDVQEIKRMVEEITGAKIVTVRGPAVAEKKRIIGNSKKILNLSGYQMKYDIVRGLKKTFENYKKAR